MTSEDFLFIWVKGRGWYALLPAGWVVDGLAVLDPFPTEKEARDFVAQAVEEGRVKKFESHRKWHVA